MVSRADFESCFERIKKAENAKVLGEGVYGKFISVSADPCIKGLPKGLKKVGIKMEYFKDLFEAAGSGNYSKADKSLAQFMVDQRAAAGSYASSEQKVSIEISYNKMNIFKNAEYSYLLLGFSLLLIFLFRIC